MQHQHIYSECQHISFHFFFLFFECTATSATHITKSERKNKSNFAVVYFRSFFLRVSTRKQLMAFSTHDTRTKKVTEADCMSDHFIVGLAERASESEKI